MPMTHQIKPTLRPYGPAFALWTVKEKVGLRAGLGVIDFLLGYQARLLLGSLVQTLKHGVGRRVSGLGSLDIALGAMNFLLGATRGRGSTSYFRGEFGNLQDRQGLPCGYMVAHIDVNLTDISCNLGVNIHILKGFESAGNGEGVFDGAAMYAGYCSYGNSRNLRIRIAGFRTGMNNPPPASKKSGQEKNPDNKLHFS
jgi:hypothetical protein